MKKTDLIKTLQLVIEKLSTESSAAQCYCAAEVLEKLAEAVALQGDQMVSPTVDAYGKASQVLVQEASAQLSSGTCTFFTPPFYEASTKVVKPCTSCQKNFQPSSSRAKFCSPECRREGKRLRDRRYRARKRESRKSKGEKS
jgi:predicted RNA-binding Zn-ribbon protein involved in translation (DUF1610 family)